MYVKESPASESDIFGVGKWSTSSKGRPTSDL
jgi:hypothetical protein